MFRLGGLERDNLHTINSIEIDSHMKRELACFLDNLPMSQQQLERLRDAMRSYERYHVRGKIGPEYNETRRNVAGVVDQIEERLRVKSFYPRNLHWPL